MPKILIVDDEPSIRAFLQIVLARAGHDVVTVNGGREAVNACLAQQFDVLLSDVTMPAMDGHELARRVAVLCPRARAVLMSGYASPCDNCPHSRRCVLLPKPFGISDVLSAINTALGRGPQYQNPPNDSR